MRGPGCSQWRCQPHRGDLHVRILTAVRACRLSGRGKALHAHARGDRARAAARRRGGGAQVTRVDDLAILDDRPDGPDHVGDAIPAAAAQLRLPVRARGRVRRNGQVPASTTQTAVAGRDPWSRPQTLSSCETGPHQLLAACC